MSIDIEIVELIEQFGRVPSIGLALAVKHFGRDHVSIHSERTQLTMKSVAKSARFLDQDDAVFASDQLSGQINDGAATARAAMNGPAAGDAHHEYCTVELDIEGDVNHCLFGPKSLKDCRKMGNDVIFQFVVNHTSRMAPSGAVLEAYMTLTATRCKFTFQMEQVFERGRDYIMRWIQSGWIRISDAPLYPSTITSLQQAMEFLQQHGAAGTRYLENSPSIDPTEDALRVYESQTI